MIKKDELKLEQDRLQFVLSIVEKKLAEAEKESSVLRSENIEMNRNMWDEVPKNIEDMGDTMSFPMYLNDMKVMALRREGSAQKINMLRRIRKSPWFARLDFIEDGEREAESFYIGVGNVTDDTTMQILVCDWRASVSGMYYDFEPGRAGFSCPNGRVEGELLRKIQYKISDGTIKLMFDSNVAIEDETLIQMLRHNTSVKMKNIVSTIQKEQNSIIRSRDNMVLIVSGSAGSGKTSVALHRVAFLLYRYGRDIDGSDVVIFSPNSIFSEYISEVLPQLGEKNVAALTLRDCIFEKMHIPGNYTVEKYDEYMNLISSKKKNQRYKSRTKSISLKSSGYFGNMLKQYARYLTENKISFVDIVINGETVFSKADMLSYYAENCAGMTTAFKLIRIKNVGNDRIEEWVRTRTDQLMDVELNELDAPATDMNNLKATCFMKARNESRDAVALLASLTEKDVFAYYRELFENKTLMAEIDRDGLFDEDVCKDTTRSFQTNIIRYEDLMACYRLNQYLGYAVAEKNIQHVVVDEAQDYSAIQFEILNTMYPAAGFTILGDPRQNVNSYTGISTMRQAADSFINREVAFNSLTKCFRSTKEIWSFCDGIYGGDADIDVVDRHGEEPQLIKYSDRTEMYGYIEDMIAKINASTDKDGEDDDSESIDAQFSSAIGIICKNSTECGIFAAETVKYKNLGQAELFASGEGIFRQGISILPVYLAKGLEFDTVFVIDADKETYNGDEDRGMLFTACSRALHRLYVLYAGEPSPLLERSK